MEARADDPVLSAAIERARRRARRRAMVWTAVVTVVVAVALLALSVVISYNGRQDLVTAQRAGCLRGAKTTTLLVNFGREEQQVNAKLAGIGPSPALNRFLRAAAAREDVLLKAIDRRIDPGAWGGLNPIGRRYVATLGSRAFSCRRAFPSASFRIW